MKRQKLWLALRRGCTDANHLWLLSEADPMAIAVYLRRLTEAGYLVGGQLVRDTGVLAPEFRCGLCDYNLGGVLPPGPQRIWR